MLLDNPPLNLLGPEFVPQIREIVTELENDDRATRIASFSGGTTKQDIAIVEAVVG